MTKGNIHRIYKIYIYKSYHIDGIHIPLRSYAFVHVGSDFAGLKTFYCSGRTRMDEVSVRASSRAPYKYTWMRSLYCKLHTHMDERPCVYSYVHLINFWNWNRNNLFFLYLVIIYILFSRMVMLYLYFFPHVSQDHDFTCG